MIRMTMQKAQVCPRKLSGGQKQRLAIAGTPEQLFDHPQNPRTQEFLSQVL